jgi:ABC-type phosphate transport system auxiliary subunit
MGEIKSAWQIAQEKTSKLGKPSPEEQKKQRQDRCRLIGKSLAEKYLSQYDVRLLEIELNKHSPEDKDIIRQAAIHRLIEGINLGHRLRLDEISQGILNLSNDKKAAQTLGKIKELLQEYNEIENREKQEIDKAGREVLHQLRISGTAISQINIRAKEEWQKKLNHSAHPFEEELNRLKHELLRGSHV